MWSKLSETKKKVFKDQYEEEKQKYKKLKDELGSESEEEPEEYEEEKKNTKKKNSKAKAKTKKAQVCRNNSKACNCGKCGECKYKKIWKYLFLFYK